MVIHLRLVLVAAAALCAMGMFATTLMARASTSAGCSPMHYDSGPTLLGCHRGLFTGYPNLLGKGCKAVGVSGSKQLWACPAKH